VTVPVDYKADPTRVINMFLVELHNRVPAEMQGFHRREGTSADIRQWFVDEDSTLLTLVRQLSPPEQRPFCEVTESGHLVVREITYITQPGLEELTTRALTEAMLPALDM